MHHLKFFIEFNSSLTTIRNVTYSGNPGFYIQHEMMIAVYLNP